MQTFSFQEHIAGLEDPRQDYKIGYPLDEMMLLVLCGTIAGCETFVDIALYGAEKLDFLRTLAPFKNGTPSHDALSSLFRRLDSAAFEAVFRDWAQGLNARLGSDAAGQPQSVVAVDGKTLRGSKKNGTHALHLISAWACGPGLVLGQRASSGKKNEIVDIPALLDLLVLKGAIVTCDAMGCQKAIAARIKEKEADYLLALKGNQGTLHEDVKLFFDDPESLAGLDVFETENADKGRVETRRHYVCHDLDWLCARHEGWAGLSMIGMIRSTRETGGKTTESVRFYIGSQAMSAQSFAHAARAHWGIENNLHWVLDVTFRDDDCRVREDDGPMNFSIIKHMAMNLLKRAQHKTSIRAMRKQAGWNNSIMRTILAA
jgi:predicted transposase YbfD/YdcC